MEVEKRYKVSEAAEILGVRDYYIRNLEKYVGVLYPVDEVGVKFLTQTQMDLVREIVELKEKKGLSYAAISHKLVAEGKIAENEMNALENTALDQMTVIDLKKALDKMYMEIVIEREEQITKSFEQKLEQQKDYITDEVTRRVAEKVREQLSAENQKLMQMISDMREQDKKSIWKKLFKK